MSTWTSSYGGGQATHFLTVEVRCIDCGRVERLQVDEPNSRYYGGGNELEKLGLSFMRPPQGWHTRGFGACQIRRCAVCYDAYDLTQEPIRRAQREAEQVRIEAMPIAELLDRASRPQASPEFLRVARAKLGMLPQGEAPPA